MPVEHTADDARALWQSQPTDDFRMSPAALHAMVARAHRRLRWMTVAMYAIAPLYIALSAAGLVAFRDPFMRVGLVGFLLTFVQILVVMWRTRRDREAARLTPDPHPAVVFYRADLARHRDLNRGPQLWVRFGLVIPAGCVFFYGFARAYPRLAWFIHVEWAAFLVGMTVALVVAHRRARRYQRQLDELDALRGHT